MSLPGLPLLSSEVFTQAWRHGLEKLSLIERGRGIQNRMIGVFWVPQIPLCPQLGLIPRPMLSEWGARGPLPTAGSPGPTQHSLSTNAMGCGMWGWGWGAKPSPLPPLVPGYWASSQTVPCVSDSAPTWDRCGCHLGNWLCSLGIFTVTPVKLLLPTPSTHGQQQGCLRWWGPQWPLVRSPPRSSLDHTHPPLPCSPERPQRKSPVRELGPAGGSRIWECVHRRQTEAGLSIAEPPTPPEGSLCFGMFLGLMWPPEVLPGPARTVAKGPSQASAEPRASTAPMSQAQPRCYHADPPSLPGKAASGSPVRQLCPCW